MWRDFPRTGFERELATEPLVCKSQRGTILAPFFMSHANKESKNISMEIMRRFVI